MPRRTRISKETHQKLLEHFSARMIRQHMLSQSSVLCTLFDESKVVVLHKGFGEKHSVQKMEGNCSILGGWERDSLLCACNTWDKVNIRWKITND